MQCHWKYSRIPSSAEEKEIESPPRFTSSLCRLMERLMKRKVSSHSIQLYDDIITSILEYLNQERFFFSTRLSKAWHSAAQRMRCREFEFHLRDKNWSLQPLFNSSLKRHITHIITDFKDWNHRQQEYHFTCDSLAELNHQLPQVTHLQAAIDINADQSKPFIFPAQLQSLTVRLTEGEDFDNTDAYESRRLSVFNLVVSLIEAISHCKNLKSLSFPIPLIVHSRLFSAVDGVNHFSPLLSLTQLESLVIDKFSLFDWSQQHISAFLAMPSITEVQLGYHCFMSFHTTRLLSEDENCVKIRRVGVNIADALSDHDLLHMQTLVSIQQLNLRYWRRFPSFLSSFSQLTQLTVEEGYSDETSSVDEVADSISQCVGLTALSIQHTQLNSKHINKILSGMMKLSILDLSFLKKLESLSFLESNPHLHSTLKKLKIEGCCYVPREEFEYVKLLKELNCLECRHNSTILFGRDQWDIVNRIDRQEMGLPSRILFCREAFVLLCKVYLFLFLCTIILSFALPLRQVVRVIFPICYVVWALFLYVSSLVMCIALRFRFGVRLTLCAMATLQGLGGLLLCKSYFFFFAVFDSILSQFVY